MCIFFNASLFRDISASPIWCGILCSFSPFQELSVKTKDLINNLTKLAVEPEGGGKARVTLEALKQRKLTAVVENFLFNLAAAEGLVWNTGTCFSI